MPDASPNAASVGASPAPVAVQASNESPATAPAKPAKIAPFSDWDWTWLNGNPRTKDAAFDSKFFTPEIRADATYTYDFNKPIDNTITDRAKSFVPMKSSWNNLEWAATSTMTMFVPA